MSSNNHQFAFVGGLHRSGTSIFARTLGTHPLISRLEGTGVPEDEGQHLQSLYPTAAKMGGPGRFGFHSDAHLTENSPLSGQGSAEKLFAEWSPYWNLSKPVLLEKSPPNLLRTRFLRRLFPRSVFFVLIRHPLAVAYATRKWLPSHSVEVLPDHWIHCYRQFLIDRDVLKQAATIVQYESFVRAPEQVLRAAFQLIGTGFAPLGLTIGKDANQKHLLTWRQQAKERRLRLIDEHEKSVNSLGYSLAASLEGSGVLDGQPQDSVLDSC